MNTNLDKIALDLYGKIETRFKNIKMGDEHGEVLSKKTEIPKARFFEFEYKEEGERLGTIAITLDEDDGIIVEISGDLADSRHRGAFRFIRSFRQFAKNRLLNFDVQNIGKDNLDKRDYEFKAKPKEETMSPIMENKLYGNARMSYQDLGEARLIVKHSQPINTELAAGRSMHIEAIYVENADGERFKYPYKHLNGARALAEHIKAGGNPYDSIGQYISSLSEELVQLRKFKSYVGRNDTLSEAMDDINMQVAERIETVKKEVSMLQRPSYYQSFAESFEANESQDIPEEILNDWIDRLTIRTFNEELKTAFPYIYRLVGESGAPVKELHPEDFLDEERTETKNEKGEVVSWKDESDWRPASGKQGRGKVTNLSDKARRETEKLSKDKKFAESPLGGPGQNIVKRFTQKLATKPQTLEKTVADFEALTASRMKQGVPIDPLISIDEIEKTNPAQAKALRDYYNKNPEKLRIMRMGGSDTTVPGQVKRSDGPGTQLYPTEKDYSPKLGPKPEIPPFLQKESIQPEDYFENFMDSLMESDDEYGDGIFDENPSVKKDALQTLNDCFKGDEYTPGMGGINLDKLTKLVPDPMFIQKIEELKQTTKNSSDKDVTAAIEYIMGEVALKNDELAEILENGMINFNGSGDDIGGEEPAEPPADIAPAPEAPPADATAAPAPDATAAPAPDAVPPTPAPVAEDTGSASPLSRSPLSKIKAKLIQAKECGATLETVMDFGHKAMTLHDAMRECGIDPRECGFGGDDVLQQMKDLASGFFNREAGNTTIGPTRILIKAAKEFPDHFDEDGNPATPEAHEFAELVNKIDPMQSTPKHGGHSEIDRIKHLAGAHSNHEEGVSEDPQALDLNVLMQQLKALQDNPQQQQQLQQSVQKMFGDKIADVQKQMPNQNVQFPGGQMNPADMMKDIMSKINFGN